MQKQNWIVGKIKLLYIPNLRCKNLGLIFVEKKIDPAEIPQKKKRMLILLGMTCIKLHDFCMGNTFFWVLALTWSPGNLEYAKHRQCIEKIDFRFNLFYLVQKCEGVKIRSG